MSSRATSKLVAKKVEVTTDVSPFTFPSITADRSSNNKNGHTSYSDITKQTLEIQEPYKDRGGLNPRQKKWKYGFDRVFNPNDSQVDVWEGACPLVQSCLDGFNVCMFAYGQVRLLLPSYIV
jgi:kinesin family protein C1